MAKESSNFVGVHHPTENNPKLFEYPSSEVCSLIASGEVSAEFGCPKCVQEGVCYCSCSHGLDSCICEYAILK